MKCRIYGNSIFLNGKQPKEPKLTEIQKGLFIWSQPYRVCVHRMMIPAIMDVLRVKNNQTISNT